MRFDIMTLFPALVDTVLSESIIGRARKAGIIDIHAHNIRDYSKDKHRRVDDTPYGGGKGMLMSPVPIYDCYLDVTNPEKNPSERRRVLYMSPQGAVLTEAKAKEFSEKYDNIIILCGHYEGVDQRVLDKLCDEEISIGDYVLTGGELPAMVLCDSIVRLCDGVLKSEECYTEESIYSGLLEYPQYTRPPVWQDREVPLVLMSGHHANIAKYKRDQSILETAKKRPELLKTAELTDKEKAFLKENGYNS